MLFCNVTCCSLIKWWNLNLLPLLLWRCEWFVGMKKCSRRNILGLPELDHKKPCSFYQGLWNTQVWNTPSQDTPSLSIAPMLWGSQIMRGHIWPLRLLHWAELITNKKYQLPSLWGSHCGHSVQLRSFLPANISEFSCMTDALTELPTWAQLTHRTMRNNIKLF